MSDYSELKRLAESCKGWDNMTSCWPDQEQDGDADISWIVGYVGEDGDKYPVLELNTVQYDAPDDAEKLARFYAGANPAAVLALIAENERLSGECEGCPMAIAEELRKERDQLKAENELAGMRIKELDLLFGRYILAMRSAVIEEEHGKGPAAAMEWIYNSLAGPGELPPEGETDSQGYFDREIVAVDRGMSEIMAFHRARRAAMSQGEQA